MTNKEALESLMDNAENGYVDIEEVKFVFAEMQSNSDEDCISRKDAEMCLTANITDMTIEEYISMVGDRIKGLSSIQPKPKTDVLDKIRAEIHATAELHEDGDYYLRDEWIDEIFDDYKAESEDKG